MSDFDVLGTGDVHLGNVSGMGSIDDKGINSFLYIKRDVFMEIIEYAAKNNLILTICGDLLDSPTIDSATAKVLHSCMAAIVAKDVKTIILTGNHDFDGLRSSTGAYGELNMKGIYFIDSPRVIKLRDIEFYCVPYMGKTVEQQYEMVKVMTNRAKDSNTKKRMLLLHYPIIGCKYDAGMKANSGFNLRKVMEESNPFLQIWAGDFHDRQLLDGVPNFLYLGQPYWADFSSVGKKRGFTVFNSSTKKRKLIEPTNCPRFHEITNITKASDIEGDLENMIVKVHADPEVDPKGIYDRCYALGAIKVLVRRKRKPMTSDAEGVKYKYSSDRRTAIEVFAKSNAPKNIDVKSIIDAGINALNEVRTRQGRHAEAGET
jgi:DNA repair exonuclease SbcCD nuclease subunit